MGRTASFQVGIEWLWLLGWIGKAIGKNPCGYGVVLEHSPTVFLQVPAAADVSCASLLAAPTAAVNVSRRVETGDKKEKSKFRL